MWKRMSKTQSQLTACFLLTLLFGVSLSPGPAKAQAQKDSSQQIQTLLQAIQAHPKQDSLYLELGELYLDQMQWTKAYEAFQIFCFRHSNSVAGHIGKGRAQAGMGPDDFGLIEAFMKFIGQDHYTVAKREFKKALSIDPNSKEAYYYLARTYLDNIDEKEKLEAIDALRNVLRMDSLYKDADYYLGVAYQQAGDYANAEQVYLANLARHRFVLNAMMRLSEVYLALGKPDRAISYYLDSIEQIKDEGLLETLYLEHEILLSKEEKEAYQTLPLEERGAFFKRFWRSKDPTPTTERNERFEEHFRRVEYAKTYFQKSRPPYFDDRGKIYIKYGEPDDEYRDIFNKDFAEKGNISWTYEMSLGPGMTFDFVNFGFGGFKQVASLAEAAPATLHYLEKMAYGASLYRARSSLSPSYFEIGTRVMLGDPQVAAYAVVDFEAERFETQLNAPLEVYHYEIGGEPLETHYTFCRFQEPKDTTRTEFYFAIPFKPLHFVPDCMGGLESTLTYTMLIQDKEFNTIQRRIGHLPIQADTSQDLSNAFLVHQENFNLAPGSYRYVVRIENAQGDARCLYTNPVEIKKPTAGELALSDIQLAEDVMLVGPEKNPFVKNDLEVMPHPYWIVQIDNPIYLYFEGYNLTCGIFGETNYTLTYKLKMTKVDKDFLSKAVDAVGNLFTKEYKEEVGSTIERAGHSRTVVEYLALDLSNMKTGEADLVVQLTDKRTGQTVEETRALKLVREKAE